MLFSKLEPIELSMERKEIIEEQIQMCEELVDMENNSKWGLLAQVYLKRLRVYYMTSVDANEKVNKENIKELCSKLKAIDVMHSSFYDYLSTFIFAESS